MTQKKVALVTGSGKRRVGWHVAKALAQRGYDLAIHYRSSKLEAEMSAIAFRNLGVQAEVYQADLTDEASVKFKMEQVFDRFGQLDVLVNCAASWQRKSLDEITANDVRIAFETNTLGTFICSQLAGLQMVKQPTGGCIITVGDWAIERPYAGYAAYFVSKGALPTLTRTLAVELGTRNPNVRVNCIHPGPVMLPPDLPEDERNESINATLVKREGSPDHIAQTVLFLIDNDFITGACIPVDGGRTVFSPDSVV